MSRARHKTSEQLGDITMYGKELTRRAKSKCEICGGTGELRPYDSAPEREPDMTTLILVCHRCRSILAGKKEDPRTLRFLESAAWNENPTVATAAKQMLASIDEDWAREVLDMVS